MTIEYTETGSDGLELIGQFWKNSRPSRFPFATFRGADCKTDFRLPEKQLLETAPEVNYISILPGRAPMALSRGIA